jgi:inosose dehydratase
LNDGLTNGQENFKLMIHIANAPCSWGALEFDLEQKSEPIGYAQVLDEMTQTKYQGTELGDWGFMPTDPSALRSALVMRNLELVGAFVPVNLKDKASHSAGVKHALKVAQLMHEAGYSNAFIVLADENGTDSVRTLNAGRVKKDMQLSEVQWNVFADGCMRISEKVQSAYQMRTVFHHHCAGFVETPDEIAKLMHLTDPSLMGLCFDTGHYAFGGGDPTEGLQQFQSRIWHVHFKDFDPKVAQLSSAANGDYFDAISKGVFCELGKGAVDFSEVKNILDQQQYKGWIVVEQDVLPGMGEPKACAASNRNYLTSIGL